MPQLLLRNLSVGFTIPLETETVTGWFAYYTFGKTFGLGLGHGLGLERYDLSRSK